MRSNLIIFHVIKFLFKSGNSLPSHPTIFNHWHEYEVDPWMMQWLSSIYDFAIRKYYRIVECTLLENLCHYWIPCNTQSIEILFWQLELVTAIPYAPHIQGSPIARFPVIGNRDVAHNGCSFTCWCHECGTHGNFKFNVCFSHSWYSCLFGEYCNPALPWCRHIPIIIVNSGAPSLVLSHIYASLHRYLRKLRQLSQVWVGPLHDTISLDLLGTRREVGTL